MIVFILTCKSCQTLTCFLGLVDSHHESPYWSSQQARQEVFQQTCPSSSCHFKDRDSAPVYPELLTHSQLCGFGLTNTHIRSGTPPAGPVPHQHTHPSPEHYLSPDNLYIPQSDTPPSPPSPPGPTSNSYAPTCTSSGPHLATPLSTCALGSTSRLHTQ